MIKVGVARTDISPRKPMFLLGYPHVPRTSTGMHDPLYASALTIHDGSNGIVFGASGAQVLSAPSTYPFHSVADLLGGGRAGSPRPRRLLFHQVPILPNLAWISK